MRQPKNIIRLLSKSSLPSKNQSNPDKKNPGLFAECARSSGCKLCSLGYIIPCNSFITSNAKKWDIKYHINCNTLNVIYFLTCTKCKDTPITKTGKTITSLRLRMNNHRSNCRTGRTSDVFDKHVHECAIKQNDWKEPLFEIRAFISFKSSEKLMTYEKEFHNRGYSTITT